MSDNEKTLALLAALAGVRTSGPRKVQRPRMGDEIRRLLNENAAFRAENAALRAAVERVRALHVRVQGKYFPAFCEHCDSRSYPCDTIAALEEKP